VCVEIWLIRIPQPSAHYCFISSTINRLTGWLAKFIGCQKSPR
jgi:hypothetical protein